MDDLVFRISLIENVSERLIEEYGSALNEVGEDGIYLLNSIAAGTHTEIDIDGELYNFLSSEYDSDEPVWNYVSVVED